MLQTQLEGRHKTQNIPLDNFSNLPFPLGYGVFLFIAISHFLFKFSVRGGCALKCFCHLSSNNKFIVTLLLSNKGLNTEYRGRQNKIQDEINATQSSSPSYKYYINITWKKKEIKSPNRFNLNFNLVNKRYSPLKQRQTKLQGT